MSNQIQVGKTYKLVDASKDPMMADAIEAGWVVLPADGVITVSSLEKGWVTGELMGASHTKGCGGTANEAAVKEDFLVIQQSGLDSGAFEEVADG